MKWLLMDSSQTTARMALCVDEVVAVETEMVGRAFSANWPAALLELLHRTEWDVSGLELVGVVRGPGSFTGVRVGLAAAKGLCEATGMKLVALTRDDAEAWGTSAMVVMVMNKVIAGEFADVAQTDAVYSMDASAMYLKQGGANPDETKLGETK